MGFCMGGGLALQAALNDAGTGRYAVAIPFYGSPLAPDQAATVTTPILGLYGADDGGIPAADVKAMQDALTAAGVENSFTIYEGAPRAFQRHARATGRRRRRMHGSRRWRGWRSTCRLEP